MSVREDLLGLTTEALASLTNKGLVKRAKKDIDAGKLPTLETIADGTVVGLFDGEVETRAPTGTALKDWPCSCGARAKCRHRVAVVLAYQRANAGGAPTDLSSSGTEGGVSEGQAGAGFEAWSPGDFDDDALGAFVGKRAMSRARSLRRKGYVAKVRRASVDDPIPTVELSTSTVRFLVPRELAHAQTDSRELGEHVFIVLAAWAFRRADEKQPEVAIIEVEVVDEARGDRAVSATGLERALALAYEILLEGVVHGRPSQASHFERVRRKLDQAKLTWPSLCVDEIEEQILAYHERSARYHAGTFADLVLELHARDQAARRSTAVPARSVLGSNESMSSDMKHLSLLALGARVTGGERERRADVFFVDSKTSTTLVLRRDWKFDEGKAVPSGAALAKRQFGAGASLAALAVGKVVTQSAQRRANRLLVLKKSGVARTSVVPSEHRWDELPEPLRVPSVAALAAEIRARPPRYLRPRRLADDLRVLAVAGVTAVTYAPGEQELTATLEDPEGEAFTLRLVHRQAAPGALDLLAHVLGSKPGSDLGDLGAPRYVSGIVKGTATGIVVTPIAVLSDALHVLDFAPEAQAHPMVLEEARTAEDVATGALRRAAEVLTEGAHRGLRHVSPTYGERLANSAARLSRAGLAKTAERVRRVGPAVRRAQAAGDEECEGEATRAWVDALLRVRLSEEALVECR